MRIELKNGEICVREVETLGAATDGIYIPIRQWCYENDLSEIQARNWRARGCIDSISIFGQVFVKKDTSIRVRRKADKD